MTRRVLIVHNRYRSDVPSGENRVVESDIKELRSQGVEVFTHIRSSDDIGEWSAVAKAGLAVRPTVSPSDVFELRRLIGHVRPEVVHLHNPYPLISPWAVRAAHGQGVPVVQTVHNFRHACVNGLHFRDGVVCTECVGKVVPWPSVRHHCYQNSAVATMPMALAQVAHRSTWQLVERFLPVGQAVADHLVALGLSEERIEVRANVVSDPGPPAPLGRGVLFVGRLSEEKGIRLLLDAWRRSGLGAQGQTLTIAGDGPERDLVAAAAEVDPSIKVLGLLAERDLGRVYRACELVVFPSVWFEAHPLTLLTAQSHGRPVLACDIGAMRTYVDDTSGWRATPSPDVFALSLVGALGDRIDLERRGAGARRRFLAGDPRPRRLLVDIYADLARGPRGSVVLVGPDGSGKSAVAEELKRRAEAAGSEVTTAHFRPRIVAPGRPSAVPTTRPHDQAARGSLAGLAKTLLAWVDFAVGHATTWRSAERRGLLIRERPWDDQLVDPVRYRVPTSLLPTVNALGRLLPKADVAVLLSGDPAMIQARKPEIGVRDVERQQLEWRRLLRRVGRRPIEIDTVDVDVDRSVGEVERALAAAPSRSWIAPLGFPSRLSVRSTSGPTPRAALGIYPPQHRRAQVASRLGGSLLAFGISRPTEAPPVPIDALVEQFGLEDAALVAMRSSAPGRWIVGFERNGLLEAVAKFGRDDDGLRNEADVLSSVRAQEVAVVGAPEVLLRDAIDGWQVIVTRASIGRPLTSVPAVGEVVKICSSLSSGELGEPLIHGDLAPWNMCRSAEGWMLLDWESARREFQPLWDLSHFLIQCGGLLDAFTPAQAARMLTHEDGPAHDLLARLNVAVSRSEELLFDYLDRSAAPTDERVAAFRGALRSLL